MSSPPPMPAQTFLQRWYFWATHSRLPRSLKPPLRSFQPTPYSEEPRKSGWEISN
jgi:hypothetical protein